MSGYKKHRGLRRYYKNLAIENDLQHHNWLNFDNYGYWHLHFDMCSYGNDSFRRRKPHLDKLFRHFDLLVEEIKILKVEFQLYAMLLDYHSLSDALFLHPAEPQNGQFPFKTSDLKTTTTLINVSLNDYINQLIGYEKLFGTGEDEAFCLLFKKNIGFPF